MLARYYKRTRERGYDDKPTIQKIFALKANADARGVAIKILYMTTEEFKNLETEIRALAADVNFYKLKDPVKGITNFIGLPFELLETLDETTQTKVDNRP